MCSFIIVRIQKCQISATFTCCSQQCVSMVICRQSHTNYGYSFLLQTVVQKTCELDSLIFAQYSIYSIKKSSIVPLHKNTHWNVLIG